MKMNYQYLKRVEYLDSISIEDIGNFILRGYDDDGNQYYLIVRTVLGVSRILQIGPIPSGGPTTYCFCQFQQMDYSDNKVDKIIKRFIDDKKLLTQIEIYDAASKDDFLQFTREFPNIVEYLYD